MARFCPPLLLGFFALFLIYPLGQLLAGAFWSEGHFSLESFTLLLSNPFYLECFRNSLLIAAGTTLLTLIVAITLALILRYEFCGKSLLQPFLFMPLILPPFVGAIGLKQLFSRFGAFNLLLEKCGLTDLNPPPDWLGNGGFLGIIILGTLHLYPILLLTTQSALSQIDPSLHDAAHLLGAGTWHRLRTITLPLATPGIFAGATLVFIGAFTDLGTPLMFEFQATVPTQIFNLVTQTDQPTGYALVTLTLLLVAILFLIAQKLRNRRGQTFATLSRGATRSEAQSLSGIRAFLAFGIVAGVSLAALIPHLGVVAQSFTDHWFMTILPESLTTDHYREVLSLPITTTSLTNSLLYSLLATGINLILGVLIAYLLARHTFPGKFALHLLSLLPLALPGLVLAFAYYVTFSHAPMTHPVVQEFWNRFVDPRSAPMLLLVLAYTMHRIPFLVRTALAGFEQIPVALEEAAVNLGASPLRAVVQITLPLILSSLIGGALLTFSFCLLDVSTGMILAQETPFYPLTKAIYSLMGRITPTAPSLASALGVLAMGFMALTLLLASRLLGRKMSSLFQIG